jgi:hypothetical protein
LHHCAVKRTSRITSVNHFRRSPLSKTKLLNQNRDIWAAHHHDE